MQEIRDWLKESINKFNTVTNEIAEFGENLVGIIGRKNKKVRRAFLGASLLMGILLCILSYSNSADIIMISSTFFCGIALFGYPYVSAEMKAKMIRKMLLHLVCMCICLVLDIFINILGEWNGFIAGTISTGQQFWLILFSFLILCYGLYLLQDLWVFAKKTVQHIDRYYISKFMGNSNKYVKRVGNCFFSVVTSLTSAITLIIGLFSVVKTLYDLINKFMI